MALDVYLTVYLILPESKDEIFHHGRIYYREDGQIKELTRTEWDKVFPGREPVAVISEDGDLFCAGITHNLAAMAQEAGIHMALWRPDEIGITRADQLIDPLQAGLALLEDDPDRFRKFNPDSNWGTYDVLVEFVKAYLEACELYPMSEVHVSR